MHITNLQRMDAGTMVPLVLLFSIAAVGAPAASERHPVRSTKRSNTVVEAPLTSQTLADENGAHRLVAVTVGGQRYTNVLQLGGSAFTKGPDKYLDFNIGRRFSRFRASVGLCDNASTDLHLEYIVYGDGKELFRSKVMRVGDDPETIDIDVSHVLRLKLQEKSDPLFISDLGPDNAFWINPRIARSNIVVQPSTARIFLNGNPLVTLAPIIHGEPCIPLSVLQKTSTSIREIRWDPNQGVVFIGTD